MNHPDRTPTLTRVALPTAGRCAAPWQHPNHAAGAACEELLGMLARMDRNRREEFLAGLERRLPQTGPVGRSIANHLRAATSPAVR